MIWRKLVNKLQINDLGTGIASIHFLLFPVSNNLIFFPHMLTDFCVTESCDMGLDNTKTTCPDWAFILSNTGRNVYVPIYWNRLKLELLLSTFRATFQIVKNASTFLFGYFPPANLFTQWSLIEFPFIWAITIHSPIAENRFSTQFRRDRFSRYCHVLWIL